MRRALPIPLLLLASCAGEGAGDLPAISIVEFTPQGQVEETTAVRVRFDRPIVTEGSGAPGALEKLLIFSPPIEGEAFYVAPDVLEFRPLRPFKPATRYRARVRPSALQEAGRLVGRSEFRFHTPLFGMDDVQVEFREGRAHVTLVFSHLVSPEQVEDAVLFESDDGAYLRSTRVSDDAISSSVEFRLPSSPETWTTEPVLLRVDASLRSEKGTDPLGKSVVRELLPPAGPPELHVRRLRARSFGAETGLEWVLDRPVDPLAWSTAVTLEPSPKKPEWISTDRGVAVRGDFSEGEVRVRYGDFIDPSGVRLVGPDEAYIMVPPRRPGIELEPSPSRVALRERLGVVTHGVERIRVQIEAVPSQNAVRALLFSEVQGATLVDEVRPAPLDSVALPEAPKGTALLRVTVRDADRPWLSSARWVRSMGIDALAKSSGNVWRVRAFDASGRAVPRARVELRDRSNAVVARGLADGSALALDASARPPVLARVSQGASFAVVPLSGAPRVDPERESATAHAWPATATATAGERLDFLVGVYGDARDELSLELLAEDEVLVEAEVKEGRAQVRLPMLAAGRALTPRVKDGNAQLPTAGPAVTVLGPTGITLGVRADMERQGAQTRFDVEVVDGVHPLRIRTRCADGPWRRTRVNSGGVTRFCGAEQGLDVLGTDATGRPIVGRVRALPDPDMARPVLEVLPRGRVRTHAVDAFGRAVTNTPLQARLSRLQQGLAPRWRPDGLLMEWREQEIPLREWRLSSGAQPTDLSPLPKEAGLYRVRLQSPRSERRIEFEVSGLEPDLELHVPPEPGTEPIVRVHRRSRVPVWLTSEDEDLLDEVWLESAAGTEEAELELGEGGVHVVALAPGRAAAQPIAPFPQAELAVTALGARGEGYGFLVKGPPRAELLLVPAALGYRSAAGTSWASWDGAEGPELSIDGAARTGAEGGAGTPRLERFATDAAGWAVLELPPSTGATEIWSATQPHPAPLGMVPPAPARTTPVATAPAIPAGAVGGRSLTARSDAEVRAALPADGPRWLRVGPSTEDADVAARLRLHQLGPGRELDQARALAGLGAAATTAAETLGQPLRPLVDDAEVEAWRTWIATPSGDAPSAWSDAPGTRARRQLAKRWAEGEPPASVPADDARTVAVALAMRAQTRASVPYWGTVYGVRSEDGEEEVWLRFNSTRVLWTEIPSEYRALRVTVTGSGTAYATAVVRHAPAPGAAQLQLDLLGREGTPAQGPGVRWLRVQADVSAPHRVEVPLPSCARWAPPGLPPQASVARGWLKGRHVPAEVDRDVAWAELPPGKSGWIAPVFVPRGETRCEISGARLWRLSDLALVGRADLAVRPGSVRR